MSWIGAAVSGLGSLIGMSSQNSNINKQIKAQQEENEKNKQYNYMLAQQQNAWNVEQWERENEYNSPVNQMNRLKQAGINPNLAYSNGVSNISASSPQMTSGSPSTPVDMSALGQRATLGQAIQMALSNEATRAQIDNIKAQTRKTNVEAGISEVQLEYEDAKQLIGLDLSRVQFDKNKREWQILGNQIRESAARAEGMEYDTAIKKIDSLFHEEKTKAILKELQEKAKISENEAEFLLRTLADRILGVQLDTDSKEYEAQFHYLMNSDSVADGVLKTIAPVVSWIRKFLLGV